MNNEQQSVTGILSVVFGVIGLIIFPLVFSVVAIVLSFMGDDKTNTIGAWLGWIGLILGLVMCGLML